MLSPDQTEAKIAEKIVLPKEEYRRSGEDVVVDELREGNIIEVVMRRGGKGTKEEKQTTKLVISAGEREQRAMVRYERWDVDIELTPENYRMLLENNGKKVIGGEGIVEVKTRDISYHENRNGPFRGRLRATSRFFSTYNRREEYKDVDLNIDNIPADVAETIFSKDHWDDLILAVYVRPNEEEKVSFAPEITERIAA